MSSKAWVCLVKTPDNTTLAVYNPDDNCWYHYSDGTYLPGRVTEYVSLSEVHWIYVSHNLGDRDTQTECKTIPTDCEALCVVQLANGRLSLAYCLSDILWVKIDGQREIRGEVIKFIQVSNINDKVHCG